MTPEPIAEESEMLAAAIISGQFANVISLMPVEFAMPDGKRISTAVFCFSEDMDGNPITADTDKGQEMRITPIAILMDRGLELGQYMVPPEGVSRTCACGECYTEDGEPTPEAAAASAVADLLSQILGSGVELVESDGAAESIAFMQGLMEADAEEEAEVEQPWPDRENLAEDSDDEEE